MGPDYVAKRHSETHFANINYGYFVLARVVSYLIFLAILRKVISGKPGGPSPSRWRKFLFQLYSINPGVHLVLICVPLLVPFYHHYSIVNNAAVYIKRLGRLSYVLLTLNLILNTRSNWLFSRDYTYTDFIPLHKWLSRVIVMIATVHGILFLIRWAIDGTTSTSTQILKYKNFIGLVLMSMTLLLVMVSVSPMRRLNYSLFYVVHNIVSLSLVLATAWHARPGVGFPYLLINLLILFYQAFVKAFFARRVGLLDKVTDYKNSNLINVHLPRSALPDIFEPGSHIRVSPYRRLNPLFWLLPSHPYTVASLPTDSQVDLIISENRHPRSFKLELGLEYTISKQHDPAVPRSGIENAKRVCIICGGSGISFGLPLYRYYKEQNPIEFLQFIWIVRNKYQLNVLKNLAASLTLGENSGFHIYVTGSDDMASEEPREGLDLEFELDSFSNDQLDQPDPAFDRNSMSSELKPESINFGRRVDWAIDLSHFVEPSLIDDTWLLACGPETLIASAKQYAKENGVNFASERYAF